MTPPATTSGWICRRRIEAFRPPRKFGEESMGGQTHAGGGLKYRSPLMANPEHLEILKKGVEALT
jgi:hypothetical protein